jgi:hypothetical protein
MWADQAVTVAAAGCSAQGPAQSNTVIVLPYLKELLLYTAVAATHGKLAELLVADHASGGWHKTTLIRCGQQQLCMLCCSDERGVPKSSLKGHWQLTTNVIR